MTQDAGHAPRGQRAQETFGPNASAYAASPVHMYDDRIDIMMRMAGELPAESRAWAMDLGSGAGFTAFALADWNRGPSARRGAASLAEDPHLMGFNQVVASDITGPMLEETRRIGRDRGLTNLALVRNAAEHLPFADGSLDLVTSRAAFHHFEDLDLALDEVRRVLTPGGALVMADSVSPEDGVVADWMNDIELRRDFSHVNNRPPSQLEAMLAGHGLGIAEREFTRIHLQFESWAKRTGTSEEETGRLRKDFLGASGEVIEAFQIRPANGDIHFSWPCLVLRAVKG